MQDSKKVRYTKREKREKLRNERKKELTLHQQLIYFIVSEVLK
jgi:hypothetical protein